jgi:sugar/nucleoside kinase (ribokinase family)
MVEIVVYGKIILDDVQLPDGSIARDLLGGGGPQAAFGARVWNASVGLLSRAGEDIGDHHRRALGSLEVDLHGVTYYPGHRTLRSGQRGNAWIPLLSQPLGLPVAYCQPRIIHLITEFAGEPMVAAARTLRGQGALLSVEPLIDTRAWANRDEILALLGDVDIVTPDWPSASGIAGTDDPRGVLTYWSTLGPGVVAIRHAEHGSYVWSREDGRGWHIPAVPVQVADPTGAGNSYGGGLCAGWMDTHDAARSGAIAAVSASFMLEHVGMPAAPEGYRRAARQRLSAIEPILAPL